MTYSMFYGTSVAANITRWKRERIVCSRPRKEKMGRSVAENMKYVDYKLSEK